MLFNKRASLEISIQAIVIVVLAMTLMGLGLGFIKGMFGRINPLTEDVTEHVKQQVLEDLRTGDKKISFPQTEVVIERGSSKVITLGIKNKETSAFEYELRFSAVTGPDDSGTGIEPKAPDEYGSWFQIVTPKSVINTAEVQLRSIRMSIPKTAVAGSYAFTFDVKNLDEGSIYDQKKEFVKAEADYKKAIELKADYFDALYNLGALFFNNGAEIYNQANDLPLKEIKKRRSCELRQPKSSILRFHTWKRRMSLTPMIVVQ